MSMEPRRELSSTYFVQDRSSDEERKRVQIQDTMMTRKMGGVLPEQEDPTRFRHVIDVGCGTGGWLIETAKTYPQIELLIGADISIHMVEYARKQAKAEGVDDRVEFQVMDALRMIEVSKQSFDLLNQRFGWSYLRTWDWPNLLAKYMYATRPGGIVRITESDVFGVTNSLALTQLFELARDALHNAGHTFTRERDGVTRELPDMLQRNGFQDIKSRSFTFRYQRDTPMIEIFLEDMELTFRTMLPFLRKWTKLPENYDDLYQQAVREMHDPGFITDWETITVWGKNL